MQVQMNRKLKMEKDGSAMMYHWCCCTISWASLACWVTELCMVLSMMAEAWRCAWASCCWMSSCCRSWWMAAVRRSWLSMSCLGTASVSHFVSWTHGSAELMTLRGTARTWLRSLKAHPGGTLTLEIWLIRAESKVPLEQCTRPVKVSGEYIANWLEVIWKTVSCEREDVTEQWFWMPTPSWSRRDPIHVVEKLVLVTKGVSQT